jgi:hypothetical protein
MTRIHRTPGAGGPEGPKGPQKPSGPDDAGKSDFAKQVSQPKAVGPVASPESALAARMSSRIRAGLEKAWTKEQILRDVVSGELDEAFGKQATPSMKESVSAAFEDEPRLRAMFNDLYDRATRGSS